MNNRVFSQTAAAGRPNALGYRLRPSCAVELGLDLFHHGAVVRSHLGPAPLQHAQGLGEVEDHHVHNAAVARHSQQFQHPLDQAKYWMACM